MSRAFEGLGVVAAIVFILIMISSAVKSGAQGITQFIENYYIIIGILLLIIIAGICFLIAGMIENLSVMNRILNCIACGLVLAQNAGFLVYGFHRSLTVYPDDAFLTALGIGGFILFYLINVFFTVGGIAVTANKSWGSIALLMIAVAGTALISNW